MSTHVSTSASSVDFTADDQVRTVSAAYSDPYSARAVVDALEQVGLRPTVIAPIGSWSVSSSGPGGRLFEHSVSTAATGALALGLVTTLGSLIWLEGRHWMLYGLLGVVVGALTGWIGSAIAATAHPAREEDLLAYPQWGLTVEVEAVEPEKARLAETVMGRHAPMTFRARTRPGARTPAERVMWQHEDGLSPLQVLGSWLEDTDESPAILPRGRHLQPNRLRS
jgi:hypothetical protein